MIAITRETTREQLAAIVSEHLRQQGIDVVLVGGAVAAIYSSGAYLSDDLDLVHWSRLSAINRALSSLGYTMQGRLASHPESEFLLDFANSPVAIGHKYISDDLLTTRQTAMGSFRMLSPLDCVLDRLSAFYHFDDQQGLEQAVDVAWRQNVNVDEIQSWSKEEGRRQKANVVAFNDQFEEFAKRLAAFRK